MRARRLAALVALLGACSIPEHDYQLPDAPGGPRDAATDAPAAMLSLSPSGDLAVGDVIMGQTSAKTAITVSNGGGDDSGPLAVAFDDAASGFAIGDDACSGRPLAAHHTCTFSVALTPSALGPASATLRVAATPGGALTKQLSGNAITQGQVDIMDPSHDFQALGVDVAPRTKTFTIRNLGQSMIGKPVPSTASGDPSYAIDATTCDRPLAPSDTCTVTVAFDPATVGQKAGALTVTATPGGQDVATLAGTGSAHVKITRAGTGGGLVSSTQTGIDCGSSCDADFSSTPITLSAQADRGSTFTGWGIDCTATGTCTLDLTGARTVTASFDINHYPLTVAQAGNGTGSLATEIAPAGAPGTSCGSGCTAYPYQTQVTLTPTAATGSSFTGWSGDCAGMSTCSVLLDQPHAVTATFTLDRLALTVTPAGTGVGTVRADLGAINCGSQCSDRYDYGTTVTLTAMPATGSSFTSWTGCTSTSGATCTVAMTTAHDVTATFALVLYTLHVADTGSGAVASRDGNLACGSAAGCQHNYAYNAQVTLDATPGTGYHFDHWSGGPCDASMSASCAFAMPAMMTSTTAVFAINRYDLTVVSGGTGTGSVASTPGNISCGNQCTGTYDHGTPVTLNATPGAGSSTSWSGCDAVNGNSCSVTMTLARTVAVTFSAGPQTLTVALAGNGAGTVSSSPTGIACPSTCSAMFAFDQMVTLSATPQGAATFAGWSGDCSGATCQVRMNQAHMVTATFSAGDQVLTLARTGSGDGSFDVSPAPVTSSGNTYTYHFNQAVQITARPNASSTFTSWSGACAGQGNPCTVTMDQARSATATFTLLTRRLQVAVASPNGGSGNVTPNPLGTPCGTRCWDYAFGTPIVLTATADPGSTFTGWSTCTGTSTCNVNLTADTTETATFVTNYTLTVTVNGDGQGTVGATRGGNNGTINCSSGSVGTCAVDYAGETPPISVQLSATASLGSVFTGWSGSVCTGSGSCSVSMSAARSVTATFTRLYNLTATTTGNGSISQSAGAGSCGASCTQYLSGSPVMLTADPAIGSYFINWSGDCASAGPTCSLTMSANHATVANFGLLFPLTVNLVGNGTVRSNDQFIDCGATCQHSYQPGPPVTLTATASAGSVFAGWSGAGCSGTGTCTVTMDMIRTVTATFYYQLNLGTTGGGSISSQAGGGLSCTPASGYSQCLAYPPGTPVTVTQSASTGYSFAGWSGGTCGSTGGCSPTMSGPVNVLAGFSANNYQVSVSLTSNNPGPNSITSSPMGFSCSGACGANFTYNTQVTLNATADPDNGRFIQWNSGPCAGSTNRQCTFVVPATAVSASATFDWFATLQVLMNLGGGGVTATSKAVSPDGSINCTNTTTLTGTCVNHYTRNAAVTLVYSGNPTLTWGGCHNQTINGETTIKQLMAAGAGDCAPPSGDITQTASQSCALTFTSPGDYVSHYDVWCFFP